MKKRSITLVAMLITSFGIAADYPPYAEPDIIGETKKMKVTKRIAVKEFRMISASSVPARGETRNTSTAMIQLYGELGGKSDQLIGTLKFYRDASKILFNNRIEKPSGSIIGYFDQSTYSAVIEILKRGKNVNLNYGGKSQTNGYVYLRCYDKNAVGKWD